MVEELGHLLDRTGKREQKISDITSQLEVELGYLSDFLENLASRRPKGKCHSTTDLKIKQNLVTKIS